MKLIDHHALRTTLSYIMSNYDTWTHEALETNPSPTPPHLYHYVHIPRPVFEQLKRAYAEAAKVRRLPRGWLDA